LISALACGGDDDSSQSGGGAGQAGSSESGSGAAGSDPAGAGNAGDDGVGESGSGAGGAAAPSGVPCSADERVGRFYVLAVAETAGLMPIPAHTDLAGAVLDGVPPADVWDELDAQGECRLLVGPELFCDPACGSSESCAPDGCIATPRTHSVGSVTLSGLSAEQTLMPSSSSRRYSPASALPYPPFEPGAPVQLQAEGGDYEPFTLDAVGVELLALDDAEITVDRDQPAALRWTAAASGDAVRVFVELDIAHHGGIAARIECDAEDDGELDIPAALVTQLIDRGVAGFPTVTMTRRSVDATEIAPGCVQLEIGSQVVREVDIPGLSSCSNDRPCPDDQSCQADLTCS
jgi:hypothetical protein